MDKVFNLTMELDKIYLGDCLEGMRQLPDNCIDLCLLDPPYSLSNATGAGAFGRAGRKYHSEIDHLQTGVSNEVLEECLRVCKKPNMYIFCSKDQLPQLLNFAVSHKLSYDLLCWHKTNPVPTCHNKYLSDTEYIVFMRKGASLYGTYETKRKSIRDSYYKSEHYSGVMKRKTDDGWRHAQSVLPFNLVWHKDMHPCEKPVELLQYLIRTYTYEGDTVLDNCMGSGTTAIACIKERRHYIGFELNKEYFDKACKRIENEKAQMVLDF